MNKILNFCLKLIIFNSKKFSDYFSLYGRRKIYWVNLIIREILINDSL